MCGQFFYLGDMIGALDGAGEASRVRAICAWGKFNELALILTLRGASLRLKGKIYRACVQSVLVYGSETWPMKEEDTLRLERAERAMVRWMCGVTLKNRIPSERLRSRLGIKGVTDVVRRGRLRWFGHVERKENEEWVSACRNMEVVGRKGIGRGRKTWQQCVDRDMKERCLTKEMAKDREVWRGCIRGNRPTRARHTVPSMEKRTLRR